MILDYFSCFSATPCFIPKRLKFDLQMYEEPPVKYSAERIIRILLQPDVSKICSVRPTSVSKSSTYVVDVRNLENQDDIKKDDFGIWKYSGSHPKYYKVFEKEDSYLQIDKCAEGATGRNVVLLIRLHCTHPSCSNFKRLICFLTGACTILLQYGTFFYFTATVSAYVQKLT